MRATKKNCIYFIEHHTVDGFTIYGIIGHRRYIFYTVKEAQKLYLQECRQLGAAK